MTTPTTPPAPSTPPAVPDRADSATFSTRIYNMFSWLAGAMLTDVVALASNAWTNATAASESASAAVPAAASAVAAAAAAAAAAAEASSLVESYQGALAADPTLDKDGNPLSAGDWYINTGTGYIRAWSGSSWVQGLSVVAGVSSLNGLTGALTGFATQTGVETLANKTLINPALADSLLTGAALKDSGYAYYNSGATSALDYTNGSHQRWTPSGTAPLTIANWPPNGTTGELLIEGVNLGAATITWPTINWIKSDGTTTTTFSSNGITLQSSGTDWVILWTRDGGTTIYGKVVR